MSNLLLIFMMPFVGTALGSLGVYFLKGEINPKIEKAILGFASGVMIAALMWSLLLPAIEDGGYFSAGLGFILGIVLLLILDYVTPHLHLNDDKPEGCKSCFGKSALLVLAITLHNFPEGLSVGAGAGAADTISNVSFASSLALSIGIAIQNIPEGLVVAMPLYQAGKSKTKAFCLGAASGMVEPIAAIIAFLFVSNLTGILPYLLSFAAGAMFYVVVEEMIPEASKGEHSNLNVIGAAIGFVLMMALDGIFS